MDELLQIEDSFILHFINLRFPRMHLETLLVTLKKKNGKYIQWVGLNNEGLRIYWLFYFFLTSSRRPFLAVE